MPKSDFNMTSHQTPGQIVTAISEMAQKSETDRWKVLQETQQKVKEIEQGVATNSSKAIDKMFGKWDDYIRGSGIEEGAQTAARKVSAAMSRFSSRTKSPRKMHNR